MLAFQFLSPTPSAAKLTQFMNTSLREVNNFLFVFPWLFLKNIVRVDVVGISCEKKTGSRNQNLWIKH